VLERGDADAAHQVRPRERSRSRARGDHRRAPRTPSGDAATQVGAVLARSHDPRPGGQRDRGGVARVVEVAMADEDQPRPQLGQPCGGRRHVAGHRPARDPRVEEHHVSADRHREARHAEPGEHDAVAAERAGAPVDVLSAEDLHPRRDGRRAAAQVGDRVGGLRRDRPRHDEHEHQQADENDKTAHPGHSLPHGQAGQRREDRRRSARSRARRACPVSRPAAAGSPRDARARERQSGLGAA
jgi:hypothetical protein